MKMLPYDYARCQPSQPCPDKERCARHTSPCRPEGWQSMIDASVSRLSDNCSSFIPNSANEE